MSDNVIGIDPGGHGAIAILNEAGQLLDVFDMPATPEANGRVATNAPLLAPIVARSHARIAFCEFVGARPTWARCLACSTVREVSLVSDDGIPSCGCGGSRSIASRSAFAEVAFVPGLRGRARS
jgi:hypothetical protein